MHFSRSHIHIYSEIKPKQLYRGPDILSLLCAYPVNNCGVQTRYNCLGYISLYMATGKMHWFYKADKNFFDTYAEFLNPPKITQKNQSVS